MHTERETISVTTAADGTVTAYFASKSGRVLALSYTKDGTTPYADTVDFTVTVERTAQSVWAQSNVTASTNVRPRLPVQTEAGVDATLNGTEKMREPVYLAGDRVKVVLAQGGDTKVGQFTLVVG